MTSLPTDRPLTVADMLRLADVCERDGYVSNLGTNIRRAFTPAPAPDAALPGGCVLGMGTARSDDEHGYLVHSASGKWWWDIERDEARAEAGRAQDRALEAEREASGLASDLAALKLRVERADALAENVQRCQRAEGPCPVCKAAAADYLAVVPTVEKGAGK